MQRTEHVSSKTNLTRGLCLAIGIAFAYFVPNHFVLLPTHSVVLTPLDHWVPLSPVWIWFYIAYYPLLLGAYIHSTGTPAQKMYVDAMALSAVVGFFVFFFFPTEIPRDLYPWMGEPNWSARMLEVIRGADNSVNCLPSMHVGMSFIAASTFTLGCGWRGRAFAWGLFLAICYSTMATKQHYFVDLVAGLGLGLTTTAIFAKRHGVLPDFSDDSWRNSWRFVAGPR